jgi:hypothetical protein
VQPMTIRSQRCWGRISPQSASRRLGLDCSGGQILQRLDHPDEVVTCGPAEPLLGDCSRLDRYGDRYERGNPRTVRTNADVPEAQPEQSRTWWPPAYEKPSNYEPEGRLGKVCRQPRVSDIDKKRIVIHIPGERTAMSI